MFYIFLFCFCSSKTIESQPQNITNREKILFAKIPYFGDKRDAAIFDIFLLRLGLNVALTYQNRSYRDSETNSRKT